MTASHSSSVHIAPYISYMLPTTGLSLSKMGTGFLGMNVAYFMLHHQQPLNKPTAHKKPVIAIKGKEKKTQQKF